jgi:hypothetical protein
MSAFRWIIVVAAAADIGASAAGAAASFPGNYVVAIKGKRPGNGPHFGRLAMYTFLGSPGATSGEIREDFWYWDSSSGGFGRERNGSLSADYSCAGRIDMLPYHLHSGLQILDARGRLRGFVFVEVSPLEAHGSRNDSSVISAAWYLDDFSCDARLGVDPGAVECCAVELAAGTCVPGRAATIPLPPY